MQLRAQLFLFFFAILVGMEECSNKMKNGKLLVSIFCRHGPFSQDFGQVLAHIILSLVKIVRVFYMFACPILFVLL